MAAYQYGVPTAGVAQRPACWGNIAAHDPTSPACRGCGYQNSCRDDIVRLNNQRSQQQQFQQPQYYSTPAYQPPVQQVPVYQQPPVYQPQSVSMSRPAPAAMAKPQQAAQIYPVPQNYGYGWIQDPMYYSMVAAPPPVRVQLQGENFVERVVKNAGLAMVESLFGQCFLAVRQLVLPPCTGRAANVGYNSAQIAE